MLSNFSKLAFLSEILEKIVHSQFVAFSVKYDVLDGFQSGFKSLHSTGSMMAQW